MSWKNTVSYWPTPPTEPFRYRSAITTALLITASLLTVLAVSAQSATINVPTDQPTIQSGIDAASEYDTVLVAPGTYRGDYGRGSISFGGKNLVLISESGPDATIIRPTDGGNDIFKIVDGEDSTSVIRGFKLILDLFGWGVYCRNSSPTIVDNVIQLGGISLINSNSKIENCTISGSYKGQGIYCSGSNVTIINCIIAEISSDPFIGWDVSAVEVRSSSRLSIYNSVIHDNSVNRTFEVGSISSLQVSNTVFYNNIANAMCWCEDGYDLDPPTCTCYGGGSGGAIHFWGANLFVENCSFINNTAEMTQDYASYGGAISVRVDEDDTVRFVNNIFYSNTASIGEAIYIDGDGGNIDLVCNDFYGNDVVIECSAQANYVDNFSADPHFCDFANGDFRIGSASRCSPESSPCGELVGALGVGCESPQREVSLDVRPGSCANPVNVIGNSTGNGVLPVAILGAEDFDVHDIDPQSISLEGIAPSRWSFEDVSTPVDKAGDSCACSEGGADGYEDLTLKFDRQAIVSSLSGEMRDQQGAGVVVAKRLPEIECTATVHVGQPRRPSRSNHVLHIKGHLIDGTAFQGYDCVMLMTKSDAIATAINEMPRELELIGNHPNPFNPVTRISLYLPQAEHVKIDVFNILGQCIDRLVDGIIESGEHVVEWDGSGVSSGVYFYRFQAGEHFETRKMLLLK